MKHDTIILEALKPTISITYLKYSVEEILDQLVEMVYPMAITHKFPPSTGFCSSNTFPALEDQSPLETVPPTLSKSDVALLSEVAAETDADVYGAQLARTKAAKVTSAQQLLERAMADNKVIKGMLKPEGGRGKGKGRGKGRGRAKNSNLNNEDQEAPSGASPTGGNGEEVVPGEEVAPVAPPLVSGGRRFRKKTHVPSHGDDLEGQGPDNGGVPAKTVDLTALWKEKDSRL